MRAWSVPVLLLAVACKKPVEAPTEVKDLSFHLFREFDTEDEEVLAAGIQNLEAAIVGGTLGHDVTLDVIEGENLGAVPPAPDQDPTLQVPVGVTGESRHPIDAHVALVSDTNQVCIASDSTKYSGRTFTSDLGCWEDGTCRRVDTANEVRVETAIAKVWMDVMADFRRIAIEGERDALISRGYMPRQYIGDSEGDSWDQRYTIDVWIPSADGATTARYYAMWSSASIGVPDSMYSGLLVDGIDEYYENTDNWVDGTECDSPRDREYDRPAE